jgi:alpha-tubulin suppressor-like RCC1 family protein
MGYDDKPKKIKVDSNGNSYVTGFGKNADSTMSFSTIKINSSGQVEWSQSYQGPAGNQHKAHDLLIDHDGTVYVAGQSYEYGDDYVTIRYGQPLGINPNMLDDQLVLYPNPADGHLNVKGLLSGTVKITVSNALGQIVFSENHTSVTGESMVDTASLQTGIYILTVEAGNIIHSIKLQKM